jgi:ribosomal protein L32
VPCYRCGVRQTDPERGKSPWRRGVRRDQLVLVCPGCQESGEWTAELESCARCASLHLIRRLGQVECLDCGLVHEPEAVPTPGLTPGLVPARPGTSTAPGRPATGPDAALAEEVGRALDRLLGRA